VQNSKEHVLELLSDKNWSMSLLSCKVKCLTHTRRWLSSEMMCLHDEALITLTIKAASTSETSVYYYETTLSNNPEDSRLHTFRLENLKTRLTPKFLIDWLISQSVSRSPNRLLSWVNYKEDCVRLTPRFCRPQPNIPSFNSSGFLIHRFCSYN
jgi:hypothetical protein